MSPESQPSTQVLLMASLLVGLTKMPPKVGKQRPGAAQSISRRGTGRMPISASIIAWWVGSRLAVCQASHLSQPSVFANNDGNLINLGEGYEAWSVEVESCSIDLSMTGSEASVNATLIGPGPWPKQPGRGSISIGSLGQGTRCCLAAWNTGYWAKLLISPHRLHLFHNAITVSIYFIDLIPLLRRVGVDSSENKLTLSRRCNSSQSLSSASHWQYWPSNKERKLYTCRAS